MPEVVDSDWADAKRHAGHQWGEVKACWRVTVAGKDRLVAATGTAVLVTEPGPGGKGLAYVQPKYSNQTTSGSTRLLRSVTGTEGPLEFQSTEDAGQFDVYWNDLAPHADLAPARVSAAAAVKPTSLDRLAGVGSLLYFVSVLVGVGGLIAGVAVAAHSVATGCDPEFSDCTGSSHPLAGVGAAIAVSCLLQALLFVALGMALRALHDVRKDQADRTH